MQSQIDRDVLSKALSDSLSEGKLKFITKFDSLDEIIEQ